MPYSYLLTWILPIGALFLGLCLVFGVPAILRREFRSESKLYLEETARRFRSWNRHPTLVEGIHSSLATAFDELGHFPTYLRVCMQGDLRYPPRAMWEDFTRDRDIRWLVALFFLPQLVGRKERPAGFSLPIAPGDPLVARMDFCLFNVLIAERLWLASERKGFLSAEWVERDRNIIDRVIRDLLSPPGGFQTGDAYLYKVSFSPRIRNPHLNGMMELWSGYYDSDSSAYALSFLSRYLRSRREDGTFLELAARARKALEETPYLEKLGSVFLPASEYTLPAGRDRLPTGAHAFMTYFTTGANDADPVVNMDILEALARNWEIWRLADNPSLIGMARAVLAYIRTLAENGSLFEPWIHQYYTAPACAFLWKRFHAAFLELDRDHRRILDPDGAVEAIDAAIERHWDEYASVDPRFEGLEDLDLALIASAFPNRPAAAERLRVWLGGSFAQSAPPGCSEFFCAVYPVKVVYGSHHLMLSLALGTLGHD